MISISKALSRAATTAAFGGALTLSSITASYADGPFADYPGSWSGSGTISIANNGGVSNERIRCRGDYTVGDGANTLNLALRCASDSYRFDLNSTVRSSGGQLTGNWTESSRGVNGTVDGRVSGGNVTARVETNGYVASFNISTKGGRQSVVIASPGDLRGVNISLTRGR
ncbi:MAG: hypothetical protein K2W78_06685 [Xanthobacteraceae bacterium]|nr:hypothetical protein [Xanthobacteraceae bacterium]